MGMGGSRTVKKSGRFQSVPGARARLHANFGELWRTHNTIFTRTSVTFTRVPAKVPHLHQSSGEGAFCAWVAFRMCPKCKAWLFGVAHSLPSKETQVVKQHFRDMHRLQGPRISSTLSSVIHSARGISSILSSTMHKIPGTPRPRPNLSSAVNKNPGIFQHFELHPLSFSFLGFFCK